MPKFHINLKGEVGRCKATVGSCKFGSDSEHSESRAEARAKAEEKLSKEHAEFSTFKATKRPIDVIAGLLKKTKSRIDPRLVSAEAIPQKPKITKENIDKSDVDSFEKFVEKVETAKTDSLVDKEISQAEWDFNRDRIFNREIPVIDDYFKLYYNESRIENSNLTLKGWKPENETHDYVVKDLISNLLAQHDLRLEIDEIKTNPFNEAFDSKNNVETVESDKNSNARLETVSDFSSGVVSGLIDATERAKRRSFESAETEPARKKQLKEFLKEEETLYNMAYQEDPSDFNEGRAWIIEEYLSEGF